MAIDASTGYLDSIPLSSDLITNMNTSHFTNNTTTGKIDINSAYIAPKATKLETSRSIGGTSFDGSADIAVSLAAKATKLETARNIGGTSFDGSADIAVSLAAKATKLETARTIGGTSFDGSANIAVGLADTATKLATARTIGGTSFDGSANIAGVYILTPTTGANVMTDIFGNTNGAPVFQKKRDANGNAYYDLPATWTVSAQLSANSTSSAYIHVFGETYA